MNSNINQTILVGRLCDNPTPKTVKGKDLALFNLYQTIRDMDGNESVLIHKIVSFGKQAKSVMQYLRKGDLCCIEGTIDNYRKSQKIISERITFLQRKSDN